MAEEGEELVEDYDEQDHSETPTRQGFYGLDSQVEVNSVEIEEIGDPEEVKSIAGSSRRAISMLQN